MRVIIVIVFVLFNLIFYGQSYNDGPIKIDVKLKEVQGFFDETDESLLGVGFAPDELVFYIWAKDNLGIFTWNGGMCFQDFNFDPTFSGTNSINFDSTFASFYFIDTVVPQFLDLRIDAWEDDNPEDALIGFCANGTNTTFEDVQCSGIGVPGLCNSWLGNICFSNPSCITYYTNLQTGATSDDCCLGVLCSDDYRCNADPFFQGLDYRLGPPCQIYDHGYVDGNSPCDPNYSLDPAQPNTDGYYKPHIETFWRYTRGTSFANAIDLGVLPAYPSNIQHFNSNECYTDYFVLSPGNDVIYSFDIISPTGVNISLCGQNGAQFDSYLYLIYDTILAPISSNNNSCSNQSEIITSLCDIGTYYVVVDANSISELGTFTLDITKDPSAGFTINYNIIDAACYGTNTGAIYCDINGGFPDYTYNWYDSTNTLMRTVTGTSSISDSLLNLSAGTYYINVIDDNNCILSDTLIISEPSLITLSETVSDASCYGLADGSATVTANGGSPGYDYLWTLNPPQTSSTAFFLASGTYSVTVTDSKGCTSSTSVFIDQPSPVPVNISTNTDTVCQGGSINLSANGALSYSWSPNLWLNTNTGTNVVSTPMSNISYIVEGIDIDGCTNTDTVLLSVVSSVSMNPSPSSPSVCEEDSVLINITGTATNYIWNPSIGVHVINPGVFLVSPQDTTLYEVIGSDNIGCIDTISIQINMLPKPNISVTDNSTLCIGNSNTLVAYGANDYNWYPSLNLSDTNGSFVIASPDLTTTYYVIGTNNYGCKDTVSTTISVIQNPVLTMMTSNSSICFGDSALILVSGADNYIWSPSFGLSSIDADTLFAFPSVTTTYNVFGIDTFGCSVDTSITIDVYQNPIISISSSNDSICLGSNSILSASGASQYIWQSSSTISTTIGSTVSVNPISTATYFVTGIDINNCESSEVKTIYVNQLPVFNLTPLNSNVCIGDSVELNTSSSSFLNYSWSPTLGLNTTTGSSVFASPITNTVYNVVGTDVNGCSDILSASINVQNASQITASPISGNICLGDSIVCTLSGSNTYSWTPNSGVLDMGNNAYKLYPNNSTTYIIEGVDLNNCISSLAFNINVNPLPIISIMTDSSEICIGDNTTLIASGGLQYVWQPLSSLSSSTANVVSAIPNSTTTYILTGTDVNNCTSTDTAKIVVHPLPLLSVSPSVSTICEDSVVSITASGALNYSWSPTLGLNTTTGSSVFASPITNTVYNILGTDINGCSDLISTVINVNPSPLISVSSIPNTNNICFGASINLNASGGLSYSWFPSIGLNITTGQSVIASPFSSINYSVTGIDHNNCRSNSNFQINVGFDPVVSILPSNPIICQGETVILSADGANQYTWYNSSGMLSNGISVAVDIDSLDQYIVEGIDSLGCIGKDSTTIIVNSLPNISFNVDSMLLCSGDTAAIILNVDGNPAWNLLYTINGAFQQEIKDLNLDPIILLSDVPGTYEIVSILDGNGCVNTGDNTLFLDVLNTPDPDFVVTPQPADMLMPEVTFTNHSLFSQDYEWYFGDSPYNGMSILENPIYVFNNPGTYQVTLLAHNGPCSNSIIHNVVVDPVYTLYIPNTFTPDGDGLNDFFPWDCGAPKGRSISAFELYVYNSWGELVFQTYDLNNCWDGKIKNNGKVVAGFYGYVMQIVDELGVNHTVKGKVLVN